MPAGWEQTQWQDAGLIDPEAAVQYGSGSAGLSEAAPTHESVYSVNVNAGSLIPSTLMMSVLVILFLLQSSTAQQGRVVYSVAIIPPPPGATSIDMYMFGINDSGQAAGYTASEQAFAGSTSGSNYISGAYAASINAPGEIGGTYPQPFPVACIDSFRGDSWLVPVPPGWEHSEAAGINDAGWVTGAVSHDSFSSQAFVGNKTFSSVIPIPPGWSTSEGFGINNSGVIAGTVFTPDVYRAFIGTASGVTLLPLPAGWTSSRAYSINDSGQVAGRGRRSGDVFTGTLNGSTVILPPRGVHYLQFWSVGPGSINNSGAVVGFSDVGGWIWTPAEGTAMLSTLVPEGWNIIDGVSISNSGLILARGIYKNSAYQYLVLTPATVGRPRRPKTP
jgi:hypothetical protein